MPVNIKDLLADGSVPDSHTRSDNPKSQHTDSSRVVRYIEPAVWDYLKSRVAEQNERLRCLERENENLKVVIRKLAAIIVEG